MITRGGRNLTYAPLQSPEGFFSGILPPYEHIPHVITNEVTSALSHLFPLERIHPLRFLHRTFNPSKKQEDRLHVLCERVSLQSAPSRIRTYNLRFRRPTLYPIAL